MTTCDTAVRLPPGGSFAEVKMSNLLADLRGLARKGAELLEKVVEEYCVEFGQRRAMATVRIVAR